MFVLVSYDVSTTDKAGRRRLRRVAKVCKNYGQRVQFSVFECLVDPAQWTVMRQQLVDEIDPETDSLRFYYLGSNWKRRVEHVGAKPGVDQEGLLLV
ncbi:CRISPR-associated endoribonuclease Cas2 [Desulfomarina profundi]|uniref:CRISPR-associated endoribonuclease Cas2 n=1 Tax=Desulfomarina profundi TaxID=2772557 RepID=A0A8D5JHY6_9BACT|nr:CRISPR-associated endonuclease Cas2 [Desulfomarina profundi]BCL62059.1 CRISPR-associated endoribonuclease Cas2 [Desulfomarina profundi]